MKEDIAVIRERDPAARSGLEVMLLYNGFKAVRSHRKANWLFRHNMPFWARWISQRCVRRTNIEIHPGATIGRRLFIDHGTGVVIGETTEIGDDCTLYQGVTLGGTGKDKGKRHPTLGNHVMVGSGAKVLGPIHIGNNVRIAAGAVVLTDIPDNCTAVGVPARVVRRNGAKLVELDQVHIPDPVAQELCRLEHRIVQLEAQLGLPPTASPLCAQRDGAQPPDTQPPFEQSGVLPPTCLQADCPQAKAGICRCSAKTDEDGSVSSADSESSQP